MFTFQLLYAQASQKPVILLKPFGSQRQPPKVLTELATRSSTGMSGRWWTPPPPGAARRHDALGHDRVQAGLILILRRHRAKKPYDAGGDFIRFQTRHLAYGRAESVFAA